MPEFATELCKIAYKYKTDKCPQLFHSYTPFYYDLLKDKRESFKKVLEFGIGVFSRQPEYKIGAGLRMWRDFFPNAMIYGVDINEKALFEDERIKTFLCDERCLEDVKGLIDQIGSDIDLVIDDASHKTEDQIFLLYHLMPLLKDDVLYIIEDATSSRFVNSKAKKFGYNSYIADIGPSRKKKTWSNNLIIITK
jgi:hypothetical protein